MRPGPWNLELQPSAFQTRGISQSVVGGLAFVAPREGASCIAGGGSTRVLAAITSVASLQAPELSASQ
jgi:hypothetical protein